MLTIAALTFILAGEPLRFDAAMTPRFTDKQRSATADATRAGLVRWSATDEGRDILRSLGDDDVVLEVIEDESEEGIGRAPQPGLATLSAARDHTRRKSYEVILNPLFFKLPRDMKPLPNEPSTPADIMAAAWAGEMLHVWFYAQGISLPHHPRADFQRRWRAIAQQIGMPLVDHDDFDDEHSVSRWRTRSRAVR